MFKSFYVAAHLGVTAMYFVITWRVWRQLRVAAPGVAAGPDGPVACAILLHGLVLSWSVFSGPGMHFGFAHALSAVLWLAVLILWIEGFYIPMRGLQPLVLPLAGLTALLPALFRGTTVISGAHSGALRAHLLVAMLAYSLLTIAALHALLMAALDRQLHRGALGNDTPWQRLFRHAPALLTMEAQLFRMIALGFALLTVTLVTGIFFSELVYGTPMRFEHKTVFSIAAWLVFGALILGRSVFGWRGRVALRWTLAGFAMLLLAYVGARFVLEVILHRV